jgi:hypothetical protein
MGQQPEKERQQETKDQAGNDREVESSAFATVDEVAWKFPEAEGEFSAKVEERTNEGQDGAE